MPTVNTIRTDSVTTVGRKLVHAVPKYKRGQWVEVYYGSYEGHSFMIKEVRYNEDRKSYEYLYDGTIMGGWMDENQITSQR